MKKLFIIALMVLAIGANAESWLSVDFAFQAGYIGQGAVQFYQPKDTKGFAPFDATFKIDALAFDIFKIGGRCNSMFTSTNYSFDFFPTGIEYMFYAGFQPFKGLSINYEHSCFHPIVPYLDKTQGSTILDGGYDRVYIEIKGTFCF